MPHRSSTASLPLPDDAALERSRRLAARLRAEIDAAGGWIGFDRYMQVALNEPGLGYYASADEKLGPAGDFVTAPELSDALARALAAVLAPSLAALEEPAVLELGAGNGTLAAQLLDALAARGLAQVRYLFLETSAALRVRQEALLAATGRVTWLDRLPARPFRGAIVANEVADALPVACFVKRRGDVVPLGVTSRPDGFAWAEGRAQPALSAAVQRVEDGLPAPLPDGYRSEIALALPAWIEALGGCIDRGALMLVDYGYVRRDYYHPERDGGTLICHYRHRAHDDPFLYPGLQDISAWVDFSACADAARDAGLDVGGFTTQAQFLIGALGDALLGERERSGSPAALGALRTLLMPGEMGERFKVFLATKGLDVDFPGRDLRSRL
jgi:SAM-dependent MidA family methyltransferase